MSFQLNSEALSLLVNCIVKLYHMNILSLLSLSLRSWRYCECFVYGEQQTRAAKPRENWGGVELGISFAAAPLTHGPTKGPVAIFLAPR